MLIIETMPALNEAREALAAARETAPELPVLVMVTVDDDNNCLDGASPEQAAALLTEWGASAIGINCSTGPATVLTAIEAMRTATTLPLAAMPNAGMPRAVDGRNIYLCSPGVHGQLCPQGHRRRRANRGRLLRHHAQPHSRHAVGHARHGCTGPRRSHRRGPRAQYRNPACAPRCALPNRLAD